MSARTFILGRRMKAFYNGKMFEGVVVGETKNMVEVETVTGVKKVPKNETVFYLDEGGVKIEGRKLVGRSFERMLRGGVR
jgi:RNase P/RNase MRP subunit p29